MHTHDFRLLYLCNAFPPGVSSRFPAVNPAGHATETRLAQALAKRVALSTVSLLPPAVWGKLEPRDDSLGVEHELLLWEREPALWHRWRAWRQLRQYYQAKAAGGLAPHAVMFRNVAPVYHHFARWLRRQTPRPLLVLQLADSGTLGQRVSASRRLRYRFKPMQTLDDEAILAYDACVSFAKGTEQYFAPRGVPWLWMPSAFNFRYDPPPPDPALTGPIGFGYFGALAEHAAVMPLARTFLNAGIPGTLHLCGFGKQAEDLNALAAANPALHFDGTLPRQSDCLAWAQKVDVLVNPRLPIWGLENSFPSKIFEFAMTGKAILTTRTGGVDEVLGKEAFYVETDDFEASLRARFREIAALDRRELQRRGQALRERVLEHYNWDEQARRMVEFLAAVLNKSSAPVRPAA